MMTDSGSKIVPQPDEGGIPNDVHMKNITGPGTYAEGKIFIGLDIVQIASPGGKKKTVPSVKESLIDYTTKLISSFRENEYSYDQEAFNDLCFGNQSDIARLLLDKVDYILDPFGGTMISSMGLELAKKGIYCTEWNDNRIICGRRNIKVAKVLGSTPAFVHKVKVPFIGMYELVLNDVGRSFEKWTTFEEKKAELKAAGSPGKQLTRKEWVKQTLGSNDQSPKTGESCCSLTSVPGEEESLSRLRNLWTDALKKVFKDRMEEDEDDEEPFETTVPVEGGGDLLDRLDQEVNNLLSRVEAESTSTKKKGYVPTTEAEMAEYATNFTLYMEYLMALNERLGKGSSKGISFSPPFEEYGVNRQFNSYVRWPYVKDLGSLLVLISLLVTNVNWFDIILPSSVTKEDIMLLMRCSGTQGCLLHNDRHNNLYGAHIRLYFYKDTSDIHERYTKLTARAGKREIISVPHTERSAEQLALDQARMYDEINLIKVTVAKLIDSLGKEGLTDVSIRVTEILKTLEDATSRIQILEEGLMDVDTLKEHGAVDRLNITNLTTQFQTMTESLVKAHVTINILSEEQKNLKGSVSSLEKVNSKPTVPEAQSEQLPDVLVRINDVASTLSRLPKIEGISKKLGHKMKEDNRSLNREITDIKADIYDLTGKLHHLFQLFQDTTLSDMKSQKVLPIFIQGLESDVTLFKPDNDTDFFADTS